MKIIYLARFNAGGNEDEQAIAFALESLGHEVIRVPEPYNRLHGRRDIMLNRLAAGTLRTPADLLLVNHWHAAADYLPRFTAVRRKALWAFDLIRWPADETLAPRCNARVAWLDRTLPHVDLAFMTDGDYVAGDTTGKAVWLPQGADERYTGCAPAQVQDIDILFTGITRGGGVVRESFVAEMQARWGTRFHHVLKGVHGAELRTLIGRAKVVVAPDSPVTDRYASNRVWLTLGFGGCLLHPRCEFLADCYVNGREIVYYADRQELHSLIARYLALPEERREIAAAGLARTRLGHLYRHRVARLIETAKERLGL